MAETVTKGRNIKQRNFYKVMGWQQQIYIHVHMYAGAGGGWFCQIIVETL